MRRVLKLHRNKHNSTNLNDENSPKKNEEIVDEITIKKGEKDEELQSSSGSKNLNLKSRKSKKSKKSSKGEKSTKKRDSKSSDKKKSKRKSTLSKKGSLRKGENQEQKVSSDTSTVSFDISTTSARSSTMRNMDQFRKIMKDTGPYASMYAKDEESTAQAVEKEVNKTEKSKRKSKLETNFENELDNLEKMYIRSQGQPGFKREKLNEELKESILELRYKIDRSNLKDQVANEFAIQLDDLLEKVEKVEMNMPKKNERECDVVFVNMLFKLMKMVFVRSAITKAKLKEYQENRCPVCSDRRLDRRSDYMKNYTQKTGQFIPSEATSMNYEVPYKSATGMKPAGDDDSLTSFCDDFSLCHFVDNFSLDFENAGDNFNNQISSFSDGVSFASSF